MSDQKNSARYLPILDRTFNRGIDGNELIGFLCSFGKAKECQIAQQKKDKSSAQPKIRRYQHH